MELPQKQKKTHIELLHLNHLSNRDSRYAIKKNAHN